MDLKGTEYEGVTGLIGLRIGSIGGLLLTR
jgi:hypothetical protein